MTVHDLIIRLQDYNQDFPVVLVKYHAGDGGKLTTVFCAVAEVYTRHQCTMHSGATAEACHTDAVLVIGD